MLDKLGQPRLNLSSLKQPVFTSYSHDLFTLRHCCSAIQAAGDLISICVLVITNALFYKKGDFLYLKKKKKRTAVHKLLKIGCKSQ